MPTNDCCCTICKMPTDDGFIQRALMFDIEVKNVCFGCFCVPKNWEETEDSFIVYEKQDKKRLHTIKEMTEDGWPTINASHHIKSVKKFFKIRR